MMPLMLPLPFSPHPTFQRPMLQRGGADLVQLLHAVDLVQTDSGSIN